MLLIGLYSGDAPGRHDPLGRLAGEVGDEIEVVVVVEHHETGGLRYGGDEEVGDLRAALVTPLGESILHVYRPVERASADVSPR